jgi:hypothetical protein
VVSALLDFDEYYPEEETVTPEQQAVQAQIEQLLAETGTHDPRQAVRIKARGLLQYLAEHCGEQTIPLNLDLLVSLLGIRRSAEPPVFSSDAELAPDEDGGTVMRVNPDRPETRQRFSIGHEISHTFFPGYELKVQCRPDPRHRDRESPEDFIETLCDVGAAELLLPLPWFADDAGAVTTAQQLVALARKYKASREATLRRFAETSTSCLAAVFCSWKLKPVEVAAFSPDQMNLFGTSPQEEAAAARRLRSDYSIPSPSFAAAGRYLPTNKSLKVDGPIARACGGDPGEGVMNMDLGEGRCNYRVMAIPVYTPDEERGPQGECAVITIVEPQELQHKGRSKKVAADGCGLF